MYIITQTILLRLPNVAWYFVNNIKLRSTNQSPWSLICCPQINVIAAERASLKRASEAADLICAYGENLSQTTFTPVHCGRARSEMRSELFIGCVSTTKF